MFDTKSLLVFLDKNNVKYTLYEHPPVFSKSDIQNMPQTAGEVLKSLVLTNKKGELFMFTLPLFWSADLKTLALNLNSKRLSFGNDDSLAYLGVLPGMVSPLALLNDTNHKFIYIEPEEIEDFKIVNCHPLNNSFSIDIALKDMDTLVKNSGHEVLRFSQCIKK